jgi:hypothetical protein
MSQRHKAIEESSQYIRRNSLGRSNDAPYMRGPDLSREKVLATIVRLHELKPEEAAVIALLRQELEKRSEEG